MTGLPNTFGEYDETPEVTASQVKVSMFFFFFFLETMIVFSSSLNFYIKKGIITLIYVTFCVAC